MAGVAGRVAIDGAAAAACSVEVAGDAVRIVVEGGEPLTLAYDEIDSLVDDNYTLRLVDAGGRRVELSMLGGAYGQVASDIAAARDAVLERALLLRGVGLQDTFPGTLIGDYAPGGTPVPATFRLFEDLLTVRPEHGTMFAVPFACIEDVEWDAERYHARLPTDDGTTLVAAKLAKRSEEFVDETRRLLAALARRTEATLRAMASGVPAAAIGSLAGMMRDGRAIQRRRVDAIDPSLWPALENAALGSRREHYDALATSVPEGWAAFGVKARRTSGAQADDAAAGESNGASGGEEPAEGDPAGEHSAPAVEESAAAASGAIQWFFLPLSIDGRPVNAVASEVVSESGWATYVFRICDPEQYARLSGDELADEVERGIARLNRAMLLLNFRREPLLATEEEITTGSLAKYRAAFRLLPYLRWAREAMLGRAPHTAGWADAVREIAARA